MNEQREQDRVSYREVSLKNIKHRSVVPLPTDARKSCISDPRYLTKVADLLGAHPSSATFAATLPFSGNDTTAGVENELQTVVIGKKDDVDLARSIEESNYYKNILKRIRTGEAAKKAITEIEEYLNADFDNVWENSWVRFPAAVLSPYAREVLEGDLLANKNDPAGPRRNDSDKFTIVHKGEAFVRVPASYLLKLSLADAISAKASVPAVVKSTGEQLMTHFLSDNTSPETFSFYPVRLRLGTGMGRAVAQETLKRFLLSQLLTLYANKKFRLLPNGQRAMVYCAPHPPVRQKRLNDLISDSFYRELFMSPCLSGWDNGEDKYRYMILCHQVLSRSQLNAIAKLKEANIITTNLVVLPSTSNISLANNGTHISLGSRKLTRLLSDETSGFGAHDEKFLGDLAIKIVEHFLPLFVGTYSAAPYRLDFRDFHPEKALGFLPHELDYTHLRMIWRRWKKKTKLKILGQPITPFGPQWLDKLISKLFRFKGDFVPDFRLIDYLVALMSTDQSPALDGTLGNEERLKRDLADLGVFDVNMSLYLPYRLRSFYSQGFSGFEGRQYSLFESILRDMSEAVNLQTLVTALAYKYILKGVVTHEHIPDDPFVESERRQIFFGTAIGIPTFFVHRNTTNRFLIQILKETNKSRISHRYPHYLRVYNLEFRRALLKTLQRDAADLIEVLQLQGTIRDLENRTENPQAHAVANRLTHGILNTAGAATPLKLSGEAFNCAAEKYYREVLREKHLEEAFDVLESDVQRGEFKSAYELSPDQGGLKTLLGESDVEGFLQSARKQVRDESVSMEMLRKLIYLSILSIYLDTRQHQCDEEVLNNHGVHAAPVY